LKEVIENNNFKYFSDKLIETMQIVLIFANHVYEKKDFIISKIEKILLKQTLDGLRGHYNPNKSIQKFSDMFLNNMGNREDDKINKLKKYKIIQELIVPENFMNYSKNKLKKEVFEKISLPEAGDFYSTDDLLSFEGDISPNNRKGYMFCCCKGFFWIDKTDKTKIIFSKGFFINPHDCRGNFFDIWEK
jgi:hypothetical protein